MEDEKDTAYEKLLAIKSEGFKRSVNTILNMTTITNRVPESYFYVKLWPIVKASFEGSSDGVAVGEWLNAASGILNEIIVEDDDTKQELFRVPPYNSRSDPMTMSRDEQTDQHRTMSPDDLVERQEMCRLNGDFRQVAIIEETLSNLYTTPTRSLSLKDFANLVVMWQRYEEPLEALFGDDTQDVLDLTKDTVAEILGLDYPAESVKETLDSPDQDEDLDYEY